MAYSFSDDRMLEVRLIYFLMLCFHVVACRFILIEARLHFLLMSGPSRNRFGTLRLILKSQAVRLFQIKLFLYDSLQSFHPLHFILIYLAPITCISPNCCNYKVSIFFPFLCLFTHFPRVWLEAARFHFRGA